MAMRAIRLRGQRDAVEEQNGLCAADRASTGGVVINGVLVAGQPGGARLDGAMPAGDYQTMKIPSGPFNRELRKATYGKQRIIEA
jgi:hypothetical protein